MDRSIKNPQIFLETNILGTQNLLDNAKKSWTVSKDENGYPVYREGAKYLQVSTDEVYGSLSKECNEPIEFVVDDILKKVSIFEYLFLLLKILVIVYYLIQYYYKNLI